MVDIFSREVVVMPESVELSCFGVALLGLYALGKSESLETVVGMVGATHRHLQTPKNVTLYASLWPLYSAIPQLLEQQYRQLL